MFGFTFTTSAPDEYLAITGMGIQGVRILKAAWILPFQRAMRFSVQPHDYAMDLQAMTKEKLQFRLPVVFTVGPDVNQRGANGQSNNINNNNNNGKAPASADVHSVLGGLDGENDQRREDRGDSLMKYAVLLADSNGKKSKDNNNQFLEGIVKGIIEGEVRVLVSSMTMEEIFTEREVFKRRIFRNIQGELDQFGLKIYNANVKELKDADNSVYFESLSRKAHEGATNQARIDVADAQLKGNVGEAQRRGQQERELAKINAETAVQKTERDIERAAAEATLATKKTGLDRDVHIARIQAQRLTEAKDEELKREVEVKRAAAEVERLRATDVVKATIQRESQQQAADAKAYDVRVQAKAAFEQSKQVADAAAYAAVKKAEAGQEAKLKEADAKAYDVRAQAKAAFEQSKQVADAAAYAAIKKAEAGQEAKLKEAEAAMQARLKEAEASLQARLKEAEGLSAMADAYAKLGQAVGGPAGLLQYMMIQEGTYVELAKANAAAVQGLQPKISLWNTGNQAGDAGGQPTGIDAMRNIYQMLPPLMTTLEEQTGLQLPEWQFGRLTKQVSAVQEEGNKHAQINGAKK